MSLLVYFWKNPKLVHIVFWSQYGDSYQKQLDQMTPFEIYPAESKMNV